MCERLDWRKFFYFLLNHKKKKNHLSSLTAFLTTHIRSAYYNILFASLRMIIICMTSGISMNFFSTRDSPTFSYNCYVYLQFTARLCFLVKILIFGFRAVYIYTYVRKEKIIQTILYIVYANYISFLYNWINKFN